MEKSKLGISISLFSAFLFFLGLAGSVVAVMIAVGYILLLEENVILKKTAIKALIITVVLSIVSSFVSLLSIFIVNGFSAIANYATMNTDNDNYNIYRFLQFLQSFPQLLNIIMQILKGIILVVLGFRTYRQKPIGLKWIDKILDKHFN